MATKTPRLISRFATSRRSAFLSNRCFPILTQPTSPYILPSINSRTLSTTSILRQKPSPIPSEPPASPEQLKKIESALLNWLPTLFSSATPFSIYKQDVVFEDRTRNRTTTGLSAYVTTLNMYKIFSNALFSRRSVSVLNSEIDYNQSLVSIRWRIETVGGLSNIYKRLLSRPSAMREADERLSEFTVASDGLVSRHVLRKA